MTGLPTAAPEEPMEEETVEIHIDSPTPVDLIRLHGSNTDWYSVCTSPCDVRVPKADTFRIIGKDINRSKPFRIDAAQSGRVNVKVTPGTKSKRELGLWVLGGSGAVALGGIIVLAAGVSPSSSFSGDGLTHNENQTAIAVGSLLIVAGITGGITGGAWALDNSRTAVEVGAAPQPRFNEPQPPQAGLTSLQRSAGQSWMFPLLRGSF